MSTGKIDVICFDVFDTLVSRKVQPEYTKKIWARQISRIFSISDSRELYQQRFDIEAALCRENSNAGYDLEFRYRDMTDRLYEIYGEQSEVTAEEFYRICRSQELNIEKRVQIPCADTAELMKEKKKEGCRVICISDFYADKEYLREMLGEEITQYVDEIYVSCECLLTKRTGRLYDYVLEREDAKPENMLMVGDNYTSDYENAIKHGMQARHLDRKKASEFYDAFDGNVKSVAELLKPIYKNIDRNQYEDMAFVLYHFTEKLYARLVKKGVRDVFFLSREGQFLKKIFDYYQEAQIPQRHDRIKTHYLMVSRKATLMASLKPIEEEQFMMIFRQYIHISLYDFLSSLGFALTEMERIAEELHTGLKDKVENLPGSEVFARLKANKTFLDIYEKRRVEQKSNFLEYMQSFGADIDNGIYLVDVGWKGTIQDNIYNYFGGTKKIYGLYLGLVAPGIEAENNVKEGLIFSCIPKTTRFFNVYNENKSIFEVILGATHGSADSYYKEDGVVKVATAQQKEEKELYDNLISPCQDGIYRVFCEIQESLANVFYECEEYTEAFADIHARLVFKPTKDQMNIFYKIYHFENFGIFEFTRFKTKEKVAFTERIKNLGRLLKYRRQFLNRSFWGVIALTDAGLSFLVKPYGMYMYNKFLKEKGCR